MATDVETYVALPLQLHLQQKNHAIPLEGSFFSSTHCYSYVIKKNLSVFVRNAIRVEN